MRSGPIASRWKGWVRGGARSAGLSCNWNATEADIENGHRLSVSAGRDHHHSTAAAVQRACTRMPAATEDTLDVQEVPLDNSNSTAFALNPSLEQLLTPAHRCQPSPVLSLLQGEAVALAGRIADAVLVDGVTAEQQSDALQELASHTWTRTLNPTRQNGYVGADSGAVEASHCAPRDSVLQERVRQGWRDVKDAARGGGRAPPARRLGPPGACP